jgi:glycosyltransferase involved in cell wall biosynthesis
MTLSMIASSSNRTPVVLHVGNFYGSGGLTTQAVEELSMRLELSGWEVHRTSYVRSRSLRIFDMMNTIWRLRREVSVGHVSVFSGNAFTWAETSCWTLRRAGTPIVLSLHGGNLPKFAKRWPRRVRRLLNSADAIVTPSRYLREALSTFDDRIRLVPNAVDLPACAFQPRQSARPRLVWLRSFHETYNPMLVPRIIAGLQRSFPDIRVTMVGPDRGDGSLRRTLLLARELGVDPAIDLTGGVGKTEVPECLARGDIFLNTSRADNTPVSVMEAMACGLAIVSTDVGGVPYLLEHERDALLTTSDNVAGFVAAIRRLLDDSELFRALTRNAREKVASFDWGVVLPQWGELLSRAAQRGPRWVS